MQSNSRRLDAQALPDPALSIRVSVPSSVRAQLQDPSSYLVLQNTDSESGSSSTSSSCVTSTTYDDFAGTLDVATCGFGSYSLRVMQTASASRLDGGNTSPSGMESTGVMFGYGAGPVAGVAVGAVAFVALGVVAAIAVRRRARKTAPTSVRVSETASGSPNCKVVPAAGGNSLNMKSDNGKKQHFTREVEDSLVPDAKQQLEDSGDGNECPDAALLDGFMVGSDEARDATATSVLSSSGNARQFAANDVQLHEGVPISPKVHRKIQVRIGGCDRIAPLSCSVLP